MSEFRAKWRDSNAFEKVMVTLISILVTVTLAIKIGIIVAVLNGAEVPHG